jgi:hypothetical protein
MRRAISASARISAGRASAAMSKTLLTAADRTEIFGLYARLIAFTLRP